MVFTQFSDVIMYSVSKVCVDLNMGERVGYAR